MKIKELLKTKNRWTQNHAAVTIEGKPVSPRSPEAVKFCLVGAVDRCYSLDERDQVIDALDAAIRKTGARRSTVRFNDTPGRKFSEIKKILKIANV